MSAWLFIFGRTHELSFHELAALIHCPITRIAPDVVRVEDPQEELVPEELIHRLGGTVKIAREKGSIKRLTPDTMIQFFGDERKALTFGVSVYGDTAIDTSLVRGIKRALEAQGIHARYVVPKERKELSSVVIAKQHVRELILVAVENEFVVGETVAVQDFEEWNQRDYGRPFADPKSGMLPPKVARMAVNIAGRGGTLLDPFCGMGTILGEGLLAGWQVIGSDQSEEVVEKARRNLEWLAGWNPVKKQGSTLKQCDATHVSEYLLKESVDAIVTEPYLGPTTVPVGNVKNIIKGLEKLYIGCLRGWHGVLKPGGNVVIALPEYAVSRKTFFVKNVIDRCEILGYTVSLGPLQYSRPQAIVKRKFYVLKKNKPINK